MQIPVDERAPIIVPPSIRRRAGIKPGARVRFKTEAGVITITAGRTPAADEETPEQRRRILREIREGITEIERGEYVVYNSVEEMATDIEARARKRKTVAKKRRR